jgi:hypothetical protein
MILQYAHRNAVTPSVTPEHIDQFSKLAQTQDPDLAKRLDTYRSVASQIADRIDTLDPARRKAAHDDLNANLLAHVKTALASGQTKQALAAIKTHLTTLAKQHGVPIPSASPAPTSSVSAAPSGASRAARITGPAQQGQVVAPTVSQGRPPVLPALTQPGSGR